MTNVTSEKPSFTIGEAVSGMVLRFEKSSASFVLQLAGDVPAVLSAYEVSDEEFAELTPGATCTAIVDRLEHSGSHTTVILRKSAQSVSY